mgnify:CR=1 FL=1
MKTELPMDFQNISNNKSLDWFYECLETLKECHGEIEKCLKGFCVLYITEENNFPYYPDSLKRVRADGTLEIDYPNMWNLTLDLIG